jgi:hypothetical protein
MAAYYSLSFYGPSIKDVCKFSGFLTPTPSVKSFLQLSVGKYGYFWTPSPPKECRRLKWMVPYGSSSMGSGFAFWDALMLEDFPNFRSLCKNTEFKSRNE